MLLVQVGRADLEQLHAHLAREEPGERHLKLRIREEENALAGKLLAVMLKRASARAGRPDVVTSSNVRWSDAPQVGGGLEPAVVPSTPSGRGAGMRLRATVFECPRGVEQVRLGQQIAGVRPRRAADPSNCASAGRSASAGRAREHAGELILDHVSQAADDQQLGVGAVGQRGISGTSEARQASSPWVKVVSMPLPE